MILPPRMTCTQQCCIGEGRSRHWEQRFLSFSLTFWCTKPALLLNVVVEWHFRHWAKLTVDGNETWQHWYEISLAFVQPRMGLTAPSVTDAICIEPWTTVSICKYSIFSLYTDLNADKKIGMLLLSRHLSIFNGDQLEWLNLLAYLLDTI